MTEAAGEAAAKIAASFAKTITAKLEAEKAGS